MSIINNRPLGQTEISVSPLCYGCASVFARDLISDEEAIELFSYAYEQGINFFDTAHSYGKAEERIGLALKSHPEIKRENIVISTKFGIRKLDGKLVHDTSPQWVKESLRISLERMGLEYIDVFSLYSPRKKDLTRELYGCLDELKRSGQVKLIGLAAYSDEVIEKAISEYPFDVVMINYNIARQEREPLIERLSDKGISVLAGQALGEGLFLKGRFRIRNRKDLWYLARTLGRKTSRDMYRKARKFRFLNGLDLDPCQIALRYVLDNPNIVSAIFGSANRSHIQANMGCLDLIISEEIKKMINDIT